MSIDELEPAVCERCCGDGFVEYYDAEDTWGEDCPSEVNHLIPCPDCTKKENEMAATTITASEIPPDVDQDRAAFVRIDPITFPAGIPISENAQPFKVSILGKHGDGWGWSDVPQSARDWVGDMLIEADKIGVWMLLPDFFAAPSNIGKIHDRLNAFYDSLPPGAEPEDFRDMKDADA